MKQPKIGQKRTLPGDHDHLETLIFKSKISIENYLEYKFSRGLDNFEMFDDNLHGRLNHDNYEFTEMEKPPLYWILGPTKDGTVAEPTIKLDYRYNGRIFWINISTCSCIVQLPPVSECSIGTKFKFILNL